METSKNPENTTIFSTDSEFMLSLVNSEEVREELGDELNEAQASFLQNPAVSWAKFVLTDDQPNKNKQRIPQEEFDNLIKTGIHMPIKMAKGNINNGHDGSEPLGVITHLKRTGNKILALAALWQRERSEDVEYLKTLSKDKKPINISWEILYEDSKSSEEFEGVQDLLSTSLKAATVVGMPAYGGRTPILAIAAAWSKPYLDELPDNNFLIVTKNSDSTERLFPYKDKNGKIDLNMLNIAMSSLDSFDLPESVIKKTKKEIAKLIKEANSSTKEENTNPEGKKLEELDIFKARVEELSTSLETTKSMLATAEEALEEKTNALEELQPKLEELEELKAFKETVEKTNADAEKFASIKQKFVDANIEKDDAFFEERKDFLLGLDEKALDFTIQELVSFAESSIDKKKESNSSFKVPNIKNTKTLDIKALAEELRKNNSKK
jgi:hypothetical protein